MQRLRTVTLLDVSAVAGHHAMPVALLFFFSFFFWCVCVGGGLWSYVHHTVDVKILCSDVVRPSGCPFIFSVHAIFDDHVKIIW